MKEPRYETTNGHYRRKTPKQIAFETYYTDPTSPTYNNARQSALKAGYSESYANNLTVQSPDWMTGDAMRIAMLQRAEQSLRELLEMSDEEKKNPQKMKIWQDTVKFVSERLGKDHYSTRSEVTGKNGKALFTEEHAKLAEDALSQLIDERNS